MRIGLIAPPWASVPSRTGGGSEAVIDALARALVEAGHDVALFATADSTCSVPLRSVFPAALPRGLKGGELEQVDAAYTELADCDVIHDHTTMGPLWAATRPGLPPIVTTVHGPFTVRSRAVYGQVARWGVAVVAVSQSQRDTAPDVPVARVVHPGLDPSRIALGSGTGGAALFVGACSPESGMHEAMRIARRAEMPLRIISPAPAEDQARYFERFIAPQLGPGVEFLGEVGVGRRRIELADACALLNPLTWADPFGLVMVEAMLAGTPVIAYPSGAASEIVEDGATGFLSRGVKDAVLALRTISGLDRHVVRRLTVQRFDARRMAADYESLYRAVTSQGSVVPLPVAVSSAPSLAGEGTVLWLFDRDVRQHERSTRRRSSRLVRGPT